MNDVITTEALAKHYGRVRAVDGLDLQVRRGEIYGFLGRNGAGKNHHDPDAARPDHAHLRHRARVR